MPVPVAMRVEFIEAYLKDEFNRKIVVNPWMLEHVIHPLDGYQAWRSGAELCAKCRLKVTSIFPTREQCYTAPHKGCDGLEGFKIILDILNLKRQQGKTTTGAAYALSELFLARNSNILYLAASEKQSGRIFDSKWVEPIRRSPQLFKKVKITGTEIENVKRGNRVLYVSTSVKSVPGGSWRLLIIDEGALVAPKVVAKLVPSILSSHGLECPYGHYTGGADDPEMKNCPACDEPLEEWFGRVLIMSSSDEDRGWFYELVSLIDVSPKPSTHLYRSAETINPHTSEETITSLEDTFGQLPSMEGLMGRELRNEFTREGDEFVPKKALDAVTCLPGPSDSYQEPIVGFLDCSRTSDLSSLILLGHEGPKDRPFDCARLLRVDVFDPKLSPTGRVRYADMRGILEEVCGSGKYPNILKIAIDITLIEDAKELYDWTQQQPWRGRVEAFQADRLTNQTMWQHLSQRVLAGPSKIKLFKHKRLIDELLSARIKVTNEGIEKVLDSAEGDRVRGRLHRDLSMALAGSCLLASRYVARAADKSNSIAHQINNSPALQGKFKPITSSMNKTEF